MIQCISPPNLPPTKADLNFSDEGKEVNQKAGKLMMFGTKCNCCWGGSADTHSCPHARAFQFTFFPRVIFTFTFADFSLPLVILCLHF